MTAGPILIDSDEVNCLVYAYLKDSGFEHTAFNLRVEGRLDRSDNFKKHIPHGELIDLLGKAMLYVEVEAHFGPNEQLTTDCTTPFSLLEDHRCSSGPMQTSSSASASLAKVPTIEISRPTQRGTDSKRKGSTPATEDMRSEKRQRTEEMESGIPTPDPSKLKKDSNKEVAPTIQRALADGTVNKMLQPSELDETDPDAIRLLQSHRTEVFVCTWNPILPGLLATGSKDAVVHIWKVPAPPKDGGFAPPPFEPPMTLEYGGKSDNGDLTSLDWNFDGTLLALGSYDAMLRIVTVDGHLYMSENRHQAPVFASRFSKDGKWLVSASLDCTTCVWNVASRQLHKAATYENCCLDVDWLDNETFACCGADKNVHIMSINGSKPITTFIGHTHEVNQIRFNPSRSRLASCADDSTARVWLTSHIKRLPDNKTYRSEEALILRGHTAPVNGVSWSAGGDSAGYEVIATSSFDHSARIWDASTGHCLMVFSDHKRPLYTLSFSKNGRWLATGSGDGWLHVYDVKEKDKVWSWRSEGPKRSIFDIAWQESGNRIERIAMALESGRVGIIDVTRLPLLQKRLLPAGR
ncbi:WD40 repeat-like protein [Amylostereum chailletii]|nr:WD40 repeat-like protein [Amylostereum chailletii]